ncbi:hypothetical protein [Undibacterium sp. Tian12W]|uniref:hypothetical protein n=1 Tax=Undibacterium sp. Tian12W TaxID=3413054 RepID=UPI003BF43DFF
MRIISNIISLVISLIIFISGSAWSAEFTKKEKEALFGPKSQLVTTCQRQVDASGKNMLTPERIASGATQVFKWTTGIVNGVDLCSCMGDRLSMTLTPDLMKNMSPAEGKARGELAAQECVIAKIQSPTSGFCAAMMGDLKVVSASDKLDESKVDEVCACVQSSFNKLSPSTFVNFFKFTAIDYNEHTSGKSIETDTLKGIMINCGLLNLIK